MRWKRPPTSKAGPAFRPTWPAKPVWFSSTRKLPSPLNDSIAFVCCLEISGLPGIRPFESNGQMKKVNLNEIPWRERKSPKGGYHRFLRDVALAFQNPKTGPKPPGQPPFEVELVRMPPGAKN